jgi:hypothetical protein
MLWDGMILWEKLLLWDGRILREELLLCYGKMLRDGMFSDGMSLWDELI